MHPGSSCTACHSYLFFSQGHLHFNPLTLSLSDTISVFDVSTSTWRYLQPWRGNLESVNLYITLHQATCAVESDTTFTVFSFGGVGFMHPQYGLFTRFSRRFESLTTQTTTPHPISYITINKASLHRQLKRPTLNTVLNVNSHMTIASFRSLRSPSNMEAVLDKEHNDLNTLFTTTNTRSVKDLTDYCLAADGNCLFSPLSDRNIDTICSPPFITSPLSTQPSAFFNSIPIQSSTSLPSLQPLPPFQPFQPSQPAQPAQPSQPAQPKFLSPSRTRQSDRATFSSRSPVGESSDSLRWVRTDGITSRENRIKPPTQLEKFEDVVSHARFRSMQIQMSSTATTPAHVKTLSSSRQPKSASEQKMSYRSPRHISSASFSKPVTQERDSSPSEMRIDFQSPYLNSNRSSLGTLVEKHEEDNQLESMFDEEMENILKEKEKISVLTDEIQSLQLRVQAATKEKDDAMNDIRLLEVNERDSKYKSFSLEELRTMCEKKSEIL